MLLVFGKNTSLPNARRTDDARASECNLSINDEKLQSVCYALENSTMWTCGFVEIKYTYIIYLKIVHDSQYALWKSKLPNRPVYNSLNVRIYIFQMCYII